MFLTLSVDDCMCVGRVWERDDRTLCVCKYPLRGQTPRKKMVSFSFYILTICNHNFFIQRVLLNGLEVINRLLTF